MSYSSLSVFCRTKSVQKFKLKYVGRTLNNYKAEKRSFRDLAMAVKIQKCFISAKKPISEKNLSMLVTYVGDELC